MSKKHLHHVWTHIRPVKTWYLLLAFLVSVTITVVALRDNYTTMVALREAVYQADRDGVGVEESLQTLRKHVNGHMNTNLASGAQAVYPPIQLKETYERLVAAEQRRVENANSQLYTEAQNYCEAQDPNSFSGGSRVGCIEDYVEANGQEKQPIPDGLYKFDFASPSWSPDLAGWSLTVSIILFLAVIIRFILGRVFKKL